LIYGGFAVAIFFFLPLIVFVYCYGRIVYVMRRQMRVMAGHTAEGSSQMSGSQAQSKRVKWNIIKTMIIVSVAFIVSWSPINVLAFYALQASRLSWFHASIQTPEVSATAYHWPIILAYMELVLAFYATFVGATPYMVLSVYPAMIVVYINICVNPFIYALKHKSSIKCRF